MKWIVPIHDYDWLSHSISCSVLCLTTILSCSIFTVNHSFLRFIALICNILYPLWKKKFEQIMPTLICRILLHYILKKKKNVNMPFYSYNG